MANEIKLTFAGDSKSLEKTFDNVGKGAKEMASDLDSAGAGARSMADRMGGLNDRVDTAEGKFMGTADLLDGLSGAFGINTHGVIDMARAYGDMAGGFAATVGPALQSLSTKMGGMTAVTKAQTVATTALNTVMRANPVLLVVTAIAALTAGLVIAYKKSETFRAIVDGAFRAVKESGQALWESVSGFFKKMGEAALASGKVIAKVADIITTPYQIAFKAIASLWNNTVGRLSFKVPGWVPGIGGNGFDVPDIPTFANGGRFNGGPMIVGEKGPELLMPGFPGSITSNAAMAKGGGDLTINLIGGEDAFMEFMRNAVRKRGGNVQSVLGAA